MPRAPRPHIRDQHSAASSREIACTRRVTQAILSAPALAGTIACVTGSEPLLFQVVHVEPVMYHSVTRNILLDVILHELLEFQRQIAQMQIALLIVPGNDLGARTFFGVLADPRRALVIGRASGDERPEVVIDNLGKL